MPSKQFSHQAWELLLDETIRSIRALSTIKGGEYAGDLDRLANFRRNAWLYKRAAKLGISRAALIRQLIDEAMSVVK